MTIQITNDERSMMRAALLKAGIKTRGLDDTALSSSYVDNIDSKTSTPKAPPVTVEDTPQAPPVAKKTNGKKPPVDANASSVGKAIQDLIDASNINAKLDEKRVKEIIAEYGKTPQIQHHVVTVERQGEPSTVISGAHPALRELIDVLSVGENAYLVGGAGVGKTFMAQQCAAALKVDFFATGAVLDKHELIGFEDAKGKYHETPFYNVCKHGGVFLWDEVDSSLPSSLNYFNAVLENGFITFPNNEHIVIDREKTFFVCAANTVGTGANRSYVGRFELDRAFLDRFTQIDMAYDHAIELAMAENAWILGGGKETEKHNAVAWCQTVIDFRELLEKRNILALCTPRATRRGAKLLAKGWEVERVKECELYRHLSHDQKKQLNVGV